MSEIRPQFFLVRENNVIVPLIALDELPANITIPGVSRNLGMADTGGMTSVGKVSSRGAVYIVNGVSEGTDDRFPPSNGKGKGRFGDKKQTGVPVDGNGRKIYCSFWLRHGECMFEQQGCQYKHIMPQDLDTIRRCGLHDIPAWYQKAYGVSGLLRPTGVNQNNWRKPRGAWKAPEHNDETVNGNGNGATAHRKDNRTTATPESSNKIDGPVSGVRDDAAEACHGANLATDKGKQPLVATTATIKDGGANPITPPHGNRIVDFERIGSASFGYKYDAPAPQTPTERLPMRARRLFEARGPNNDYTPWEEPRGRLQKKQ